MKAPAHLHGPHLHGPHLHGPHLHGHPHLLGEGSEAADLGVNGLLACLGEAVDVRLVGEDDLRGIQAEGRRRGGGGGRERGKTIGERGREEGGKEREVWQERGRGIEE